jgi:hypothetical protein
VKKKVSSTSDAKSMPIKSTQTSSNPNLVTARHEIGSRQMSPSGTSGVREEWGGIWHCGVHHKMVLNCCNGVDIVEGLS